MKKCRVCKKEFKPKQSHFHTCPECYTDTSPEDREVEDIYRQHMFEVVHSLHRDYPGF